jgi:hypothetical protein
MWSPFSRVQGDELGIAFVVWLQHPNSYWPWLGFGALIGGLAFYASRLLNQR